MYVEVKALLGRDGKCRAVFGALRFFKSKSICDGTTDILKIETEEHSVKVPGIVWACGMPYGSLGLSCKNTVVPDVVMMDPVCINNT